VLRICTGALTVLGHILSLSQLSINFNSFSGTLDALSTLTKLVYLDVSSNIHLNGEINCLTTLTLLETLIVHSCQFAGSVYALGILTRLVTLDLSVNQFSGTLDNLSNLTSLTYLDIDNNNFGGTIDFVAAWSNIQYLYLYSNNFQGTLAPLANLTQLALFWACTNQFSGSIDNAFRRLTKLAQLRLCENRLSGNITEFKYLFQLVELNIYGNLFQGQLNCFRALSNLADFDGSFNQFSGDLEDLRHLFSLVSLRLQGNLLTGSLFPLISLGGWGTLKTLDLANNRLSGDVTALLQLSSLTYILSSPPLFFFADFSLHPDIFNSNAIFSFNFQVVEFEHESVSRIRIPLCIKFEKNNCAGLGSQFIYRRDYSDECVISSPNFNSAYY
jgi:Leucine-rich repeat (LRR) protein